MRLAIFLGWFCFLFFCVCLGFLGGGVGGFEGFFVRRRTAPFLFLQSSNKMEHDLLDLLSEPLLTRQWQTVFIQAAQEKTMQ